MKRRIGGRIRSKTTATRRQPAEQAFLDEVFGALADPIRRAMLARLARGECSVGSLGEPFAVSAPAITKHLRVLERSGLIARRKSGRVHYCRLRPDVLRRGGDWIQQLNAFWEQQFDSLDRYLAAEEI